MQKKRHSRIRATTKARHADVELLRKLRSVDRKASSRFDPDAPIERFAKLASNSTIWFLNARRLYVAASVLRAELQRCWDMYDPSCPPSLDRRRNGPDVMDLQPAYLMLMGFVLANLLKAHLVRDRSAQYRQLIAASGELPRELRTHNLRRLAQLAGIDTPEPVAIKLERLTKFLVWRGKYHFPLRFEDFYHLSARNAVPSSGIAIASSDLDDLPTLVRSIAGTLNFSLS
jgi:hypothetical protein